MLVTRIWKNQPGKYFCLSTKSGAGKWQDHFFSRDDFDSVPDFIEHNRDKDLYFCPHGFTQKRRHSSLAVEPFLLWADLDEIDPRTVSLRPTIAIESSPGRYVGLWSIDKPMNKSVNRRLSYAVGADRGGWDITQVLRVPGTVNYKYSSKPKTRILWSDGPDYCLSDIEQTLPQDQINGTPVNEFAELFKRWEKKLPAWARRELMAKKVTVGKRSEMLWKLEQTLLECGLTTDDAFQLIRASAWNKFRGRINGDDQLRHELDKAISHHLSNDEPKRRDLLFRSMAEVEEENLEWLYYPYLALGELTILEGDPGLGKSYLMQMIGGCIADGRALPCVKRCEPMKGCVVYFDLENSAGSVTKKRLVTNGVKSLDNFIQCEEPFSIDDDDFMEVVYDHLEKYRPLLVVFDTLNTYLGKSDAFKGHEAQQAFVRFRELASRFHCAVVVLRHLTKSTRERALYRGQGSISFAGLARVVMTVGTMPDDPDTRVMAVTKLNVAKLPRALTFTIEALPDTLREHDRSRFVWGEFVDLTSDDIVQVPPKANNAEREEAKEFLSETLNGEPVELSRLERMAEARSISLRTLHRAANDLGIIKRSRGFGREKKAMWSLPSDPPPAAA